MISEFFEPNQLIEEIYIKNDKFGSAASLALPFAKNCLDKTIEKSDCRLYISKLITIESHFMYY